MSDEYIKIVLSGIEVCQYNSNIFGLIIDKLKKSLPDGMALPDRINEKDFKQCPTRLDDNVRYIYPVDKLVKLNPNRDHDSEMFGFR